MRKKIVTAGTTALFVAASTLAIAQSPSPQAIERPSASDWKNITDARIDTVKAALQMTADQEKYWPAIEDAQGFKFIRTEFPHSFCRGCDAGLLVFRPSRNRDPVEFLHRCAYTLAQQASDLKKFADTWQPLYQTLDSDQKSGRLTL